MSQPISDNVWKHLICSSCGVTIRKTEDGAECPNCGLVYTRTDSGVLDLRLKRQKRYRLDLELGKQLQPENGFRFAPLLMNAAPEVNYAAIQVPRHFTKQILSYVPKAKSSDSLMLDLGCGDGIHKDVCEHAGFEWVGLDYESTQAQMLGDAHSLPFGDATFEFVLCITVLQYIRFPFVAMREAYRVLKPHGTIIGTVAFLEPSHGTSFYHHTHLGTFNALEQSGFRVEIVAPSEEWTVFRALANMGLFYGMPKPISEAIIFPVQLLHQLWWWLGGRVTHRNLTDVRIRNFTGSFTFVAQKDKA